MFVNFHFPMKKNSMLLRSMDKYMLRMVAHGVVEHYANKYYFSRGNLYSKFVIYSTYRTR